MMKESSSGEQKRLMQEPLLDGSGKGGFRTLPFILANEAFLMLAITGVAPNMILYLMGDYHMEMATGSNIIFFWNAVSFSVPLLGAIIADSFLGRFWTIGLSSIVGILGQITLWLTTIIPQARPAPCDEFTNSCSFATPSQVFLLCTALGLISIGVGGVKCSTLAFGADQLKNGDGQKNVGVSGRYFSWYYALSTASILIGFSSIVFIQDKMGWKVGFGIPVILIFFSALSFFLASPFYIKLKAKSGLVAELIQVIVASYRKRDIKLSESQGTDYAYHHEKGSSLVFPSEKLRFLNRACVISDPDHELTPDGRASNSWSLCTVDQVEDLKTLIKVIPLWSTGMLMSVTVSQTSFTVLQAKVMNRKIGSGFEIPPGSFGLFSVVGMALWVPLHYYVILPIASRIMGKPAHLNTKQRMGLGIFLSCLGMIVRAAVETVRRNRAIVEGYLDNPGAVVNMSAMWLGIPLCLVGFAESANAIAQNEFFYMELPKSMSSIASTLNGLGFSVANLLSSSIMGAIDDLTKRGGNESWVSSNINRGRYDYYFGVLACLCMADMIFFLIFSKAYGPCKAENSEIDDKREGLIE